MTDENVLDNEGIDKTSSGLLARVKAQDPEAWRRFVHLYGPLIYRWCIQVGLQDADAADVTQNVFRSVMNGIAGFQYGQKGATLRGWLRVITHNRVCDFIRTRPPEGAGIGGSEAQVKLQVIAEQDPSSFAADSEQADHLLLYRRVIETILEDYSEQTRQIFLRVVVGGQHPAATAEEMNISTNVVYLAKSRILRRIREEFAGIIDL